MPFKSKAQRRLFYALESKGELPKGTASKWEKETKDKSLPEKVAFWSGFYKKAASNTFKLEGNEISEGPISAYPSDEEDTRTFKGMTDLDRGPRDYSVRQRGRIVSNTSNPHILY